MVAAITLAAPGPQSRQFVNVLGDDYHLPAPAECKALALIFIGHDCPISNSYAPEINRIRQEFSPQGIATCVVYADPELTRDQACRHATEHGINSPAVLDPELIFANWVGATTKPEAAVLSPQGELLYLGRIDDRYVDFARQRPKPHQSDLRNAIQAVVAGRDVPLARTKAIGCDIDRPGGRAK